MTDFHEIKESLPEESRDIRISFAPVDNTIHSGSVTWQIRIEDASGSVYRKGISFSEREHAERREASEEWPLEMDYIAMGIEQTIHDVVGEYIKEEILKND